MATKLLGTDTAGGDTGATGYAQGSQFTCDTSGTLTSIYVYCLANSNVRVALYSDSGSNTINNLIAESASTAITSGAWRSIAVAGGAITSGTKYWLLFQCETLGGVAYRSLANTRWRGYKAQAYGAFPADGTGFTYDDDYEYSLQGWGTVAGGGIPLFIHHYKQMAEA